MNEESLVYVQWKSDCWRNTCILLVDAINSKDEDKIKDALDAFEEVKQLFPYKEI